MDEIIDTPKFSGKLQNIFQNGDIEYDGQVGKPGGFPLTDAEKAEVAAALAAPYVGVSTQDQVVAAYESALDAHLDRVAQSHRFKDRHSLALRAGYPSAYQPLGAAFATWMDGCNVQAYQRLQRVIAGAEPMPTVEEFINDLPEFIAP